MMSEVSGLPLINEKYDLKDKKEYEAEMKRVYAEKQGKLAENQKMKTS